MRSLESGSFSADGERTSIHPSERHTFYSKRAFHSHTKDSYVRVRHDMQLEWTVSLSPDHLDNNICPGSFCEDHCVSKVLFKSFLFFPDSSAF